MIHSNKETGNQKDKLLSIELFLLLFEILILLCSGGKLHGYDLTKAEFTDKVKISMQKF